MTEPKRPSVAAAAAVRRDPAAAAPIPTATQADDARLLARLAELERRSLLAEQARQLAHRMRTPLSVIELICETLQIELADDRPTAERLSPVLDAVSRLSATLTETVLATRFAEGPQRPIDATVIAARIVRLHRGRVEDAAGEDGDGAPRPPMPPRMPPRVLVEQAAFEAGIMHALRLLGVGCTSDGYARGAAARAGAADADAAPVMHWQVDGGCLHLRLSTPRLCRCSPLEDRADRWLMQQAAERLARDSGGSLTLDPQGITFLLPLAGA